MGLILSGGYLTIPSYIHQSYNQSKHGKGRRVQGQQLPKSDKGLKNQAYKSHLYTRPQPS